MTHQPTLFDVPTPPAKPKRLARRSDPETSHEAAEYVVASGLIGDQQTTAVAFLRRFPGRTTAELGALHPKLDRFAFARRMPELERRGLVRRGPKRNCTVGRPAQPWYPVGGSQ